MTLHRRTLLASGLAAPAIIVSARAQAKTVIDFMFPVAVGGPITKIVDGYAQDFMRENPDVDVHPVYSGSYVDTLTKAQTAAKSGQPPTMAVLLSTDAYTLIDDGLVLPIDGLGDVKGWLGGFYPAFLRNTEIDGHQWGVPFQRSTIVMFLNQDAFRDAGLDPAQPPATWAAHAEVAAKLSKKDQRWGVEIPATGFTYWLFQALVAEAGGELANANGTAVNYDTAATRKALDYWLDLQKSGATPPGLVEWGHHAARFPGGPVRYYLDHHGQSFQPPRQRQIPVQRGHAAGRSATWQPDRRRQFLFVQGREPGSASGEPALPAMDHQSGARGAMVHRHRLRGDPARCLGDPRDESLRGKSAGRFGCARPTAIRRAGAIDA